MNVKNRGAEVVGKSYAAIGESEQSMLHQYLTNPPTLTAREQEILEYIAQGLSTKEVAQHIGIAPRTVDRHVENTRLKLRAKNRTHMVACAVVAGLLQVDEHFEENTADSPVVALNSDPV